MKILLSFVILLSIYSLSDSKNVEIATSCGDVPDRGRVAHSLNCNMFYVCISGDLIEFTCPFSAPHFHPCTLICVNEGPSICTLPCDDNGEPTEEPPETEEPSEEPTEEPVETTTFVVPTAPTPAP